MPKATKQQLRDEIADLRDPGWQMANLMFALARGHVLTDAQKRTCDKLRRKWDAVKHSEPRTP